MASDVSLLVRPLWTRCIATELKNEGADVDAALAASGLDWRSLNKADGWIPFVRHAELFEIAARELKNDCYGMTLAQRVDVRDGDVFAYLGVASHSVEAALRNMARYSTVFSEAFQVELDLDDSFGTLNFTAQHPSLSEYCQASEFRHSLIVLACRSFTGKRITPRAVHFIHQRRKGVASLVELFGCPVKFGQSHERIIFSKKELATPITSADHRLLAILRAYAEETLPRPTEAASRAHSEIGAAIDRAYSHWRGASQNRCCRTWHERAHPGATACR